MKKVILVVFCFTLLSASALFISCSNKSGNSSNPTDTNTTNSSSSTDTNTTNNSSSTDTSTASSTDSSTATDTTGSSATVFTADTLSQYDGNNGNSAYIAIDGVVYDVTNQDRWKNGKHEGVSAGMDLTDAFAGSPHDNSQLDGVPVVGTYE